MPPLIIAAMRSDGFEVGNFRPQGLRARDVARAPIQSWDDVPPAGVDYPAARAALQQHVDALLDELQKAEKAPVTHETMFFVAALLTFTVGLAHSVLGEKFILMRLTGQATSKERTLRFAWHLTTVAWWGIAAMLVR